MGLHFEASHMDSSSHNLGLAILNHRLADHPGAVRRSALIGISIRASHKFLLIFPCMSDSPYLLWGEQVSASSGITLCASWRTYHMQTKLNGKSLKVKPR
jgi:hypothetical protein